MSESRGGWFWIWVGRIADFWAVGSLLGGVVVTAVSNWLGIPLWQAAVIGSCAVAALLLVYFATRIDRQSPLFPVRP